jgi:hypothetical protein
MKPHQQNLPSPEKDADVYLTFGAFKHKLRTRADQAGIHLTEEQLDVAAADLAYLTVEEPDFPSLDDVCEEWLYRIGGWANVADHTQSVMLTGRPNTRRNQAP